MRLNQRASKKALRASLDGGKPNDLGSVIPSPPDQAADDAFGGVTVVPVANAASSGVYPTP